MVPVKFVTFKIIFPSTDPKFGDYSDDYRELYSAANDPHTGNDPRIGPQMIPPANRNGLKFLFPGFFKIIL